MRGREHVVTELNGGSTAVLRRMNLRHVLSTVRSQGPMSRSDLRRVTGLSRPTLDEVVACLVSIGLVRERLANDEEVALRKPGRRPRYVTFYSESGRLVGADIGAEKVTVAVSDLDGHVLHRFRKQVRGLGRRDLLSEVHKLLGDATRLCRDEARPVRSIVIGTPGIIDQASGSLSLAPQIPGWEGVVLQSELLSDAQCPTAVENEMHLAVLGEHWRGVAQGFDDIVYIGLGVGVGAGIMIGGALQRGSSGAAGEIGYFDFGPALGDSAGGTMGRFERSVGAAAFAKRGGRRSTPEEIFDAAAKRGTASLALVDRVAGTLAQGIAALALTVDPSLLVLGGGLSAGGEVLRAPVERHLRALLPKPPPKLEISTLGQEATVLGALYRARELCDQAMYEDLLGVRHSDTNWAATRATRRERY